MKIEPVFLRTPFNYDRDLASDLAGLSCEDASRTKRSFKEECDINTIMRRFGVSGAAPQNVRAPTYQDFEEVFDFRSAMHVLMDAEKSFMAMPSEVRKRFGNDPQEFVEFCSSEANLDEMKRLGLIRVEEKRAATLDDVVNAVRESKPSTGAT